MMRILRFALLSQLASVSAYGQSAQDPRMQTVQFDANQVVPVKVAVGFEATVELAPDEHIENLAVGDAGAWQITPNKRGDHIFIKALQSGVVTNLTVVTDAHAYAFDLIPLNAPAPDMAYVLRFTYPVPPASSPATAVAVSGRYKLTGKRALRPAVIADDGHQTRLIWRPDQTLPAVFIVDTEGHERPADGAMRGPAYVLDSVSDHLLFRLDHDVARADRVASKGGE